MSILLSNLKDVLDPFWKAPGVPAPARCFDDDDEDGFYDRDGDDNFDDDLDDDLDDDDFDDDLDDDDDDDDDE